MYLTRLFWVKDNRSRFVYCNQQFLAHLGCRTADQVLNKTDYDFVPSHIAHQFITDDKLVMGGHLVTDRLELNHSYSGELGWFSTSKRVLNDENGEVIGTYGITRHLQKTSKALLNVDAVEVPVKYIRKNYNKAISVEKLAQLSHLSVSALERRFKKYLAKTPIQFINEVRLENARRMLVETQQPIGDIAYQCGFAEPSYFAKQFNRLFGELPSQLRNELDV